MALKLEDSLIESQIFVVYEGDPPEVTRVVDTLREQTREAPATPARELVGADMTALQALGLLPALADALRAFRRSGPEARPRQSAATGAAQPSRPSTGSAN